MAANSIGRAKILREIRRQLGIVQPARGEMDMPLKAMLVTEPRETLIDLILSLGDEGSEDLWVKRGGDR